MVSSSNRKLFRWGSQSFMKSSGDCMFMRFWHDRCEMQLTFPPDLVAGMSSHCPPVLFSRGLFPGRRLWDPPALLGEFRRVDLAFAVRVNFFCDFLWIFPTMVGYPCLVLRCTKSTSRGIEMMDGERLPGTQNRRQDVREERRNSPIWISTLSHGTNYMNKHICSHHLFPDVLCTNFRDMNWV